MNFISKEPELKKFLSYGGEYPQVDAWMKENCESKSVKAALKIATMKSRVYDHSISPGTRYWLQTANHGRLILKIGVNAVLGYQSNGHAGLAEEQEAIGTPLTEAHDAMNCSMRTKTEIVNGGIALGRLRKEKRRKDSRRWVIYPSGQQLIEFINFQLYFYIWAKERDLLFSNKIENEDSILFDQITKPGQGYSFLHMPVR